MINNKTSKANCDCSLGTINSEIANKSNLNYEVMSISDIQPKFKEYELLNCELLSPKQIVDNRRGYLHRFTYCPYCGEKLNWEELLINFK